MSRHPGSRGFSLIELLVTLGVMSIVTVAMLGLLDSANRVTKEQTNVTDAQASSRTGIYEISKIVRQARLGQLSYENAIIPLVNNATGSEQFVDLNGVAHLVRAGTDVLEVRGVIYGDPYTFTNASISCSGGNCTGGSSAITVTIQQQAALSGTTNVTNYATGGLPAIANYHSPFFFVVSCASTQPITTANGKTYSTPLYYVGLVNPTGNWYTSTGSAFSFTMDATATSAQALNATSNSAPIISKPFSGGVLDDVVFFVDRGAADRITGKYIHPVLSQASLDPTTGNWNVQPLADDVEDFQVAYGIDGIATSGVDAGIHDRGVDPGSLSATVNADEWVLNTAGESLQPTSASGTKPVLYEQFIDSTYVEPAFPAPDPNSPPPAVPALKSLMLAIVVKSHEPDMRYAGSGAYGVKVFDSTALPISDKTLTGAATSTRGLPFRRRVQTMAVNLRNFL